jgi:hypothetical protein
MAKKEVFTRRVLDMISLYGPEPALTSSPENNCKKVTDYN